jgi:hypothetical protein
MSRYSLASFVAFLIAVPAFAGAVPVELSYPGNQNQRYDTACANRR